MQNQSIKFIRHKKDNAKYKSENKKQTEEEKLQALYSPPLDSSLIHSVWNDTLDFKSCDSILATLAKEANQALEIRDQYPQTIFDEESSIASTTSSEEENFQFLFNCFPTFPPDDLNEALQSQNNNVEKATDLLLNRRFMQQTDNDSDLRFGKKRKPKKKTMVVSGQLPHSYSNQDVYEDMATIPFNYWKQYDELTNRLLQYFPSVMKFTVAICVQRCRGNVIAAVKSIMQKAPEEKPEHVFKWASMRNLIYTEKELKAIMEDRTPLDIHRVAVGAIVSLEGQSRTVEQITQTAVEHFLTFDISQMELEARLEKMATEADSIRSKTKHRGIPVLPEYLSINNQNTYEEDNPDECRDIAMQLIMERNELYRKAAASYRKSRNKGPEGGVAFYYSEVAREIDTKAKEWNMKAARATIRQHRLRYNDDHLLDLHGLTIAEARVVLSEGVNQWWSRSHMQSARRLVQPLKIVTGVGKHSEHGESKLIPVTNKFLRSEGWLFDMPTPGCFMVKGIQQRIKK
ncbi:hypothetical protein BY458DRAFT_446048 [Sporodiniella umbellata]|nr:hypothetical protein BY458DRAFT_446048 [Sporodiniella umbellata]